MCLCVSVCIKQDFLNEMGGTCGVYVGEERRVQGFGGET